MGVSQLFGQKSGLGIDKFPPLKHRLNEDGRIFKIWMISLAVVSKSCSSWFVKNCACKLDWLAFNWPREEYAVWKFVGELDRHHQLHLEKFDEMIEVGCSESWSSRKLREDEEPENAFIDLLDILLNKVDMFCSFKRLNSLREAK